jgi:signal transduction histidine kinase
MKVSQRLFLAVLPAVLGLLLVAALAYWGRYAHTAPELVVALAFIAVVISLVISWRNTRYVVARVERLAHRALAGRGDGSVAALAPSQRDALRDLGITGSRASGSSHGHGADELDDIEATVTGLSTAVALARAEAAQREQAALARATDIESLLDSLTTRFTERTQEAQLPLHILLSSPFGALNENQEEMLGAAMTAVDAIDTEVRQLRKLLQLYHGALTILPQPINVAELLRPTLAIAAARAESAHVQLHPEISDTSPRARVDAVHAQEALTSILTNAIAQAGENGEVTVDARETEEGRIRISVSLRPIIPSQVAAKAPDAESLEMRLARLLVQAQGGTLTRIGDTTIVEFPSEAASRVTR